MSFSNKTTATKKYLHSLLLLQLTIDPQQTPVTTPSDTIAETRETNKTTEKEFFPLAENYYIYPVITAMNFLVNAEAVV
jgi:hypothetical protein